jgi:two-component system CheB/CheR fusion protein
VAELRAELARAARLQAVAAAFLRDGDLPRLLDAALAETLALAGADRGCVQVLDGAGGGLRLAAQHGLVRPFLEHVATLRTGLGGSAAVGNGSHWLVDDVATSEALAGTADREALLGAHVHGLLVTPLRAPDGRVLGLLTALHRDAPDPPAFVLEALERVAELCAAALAHAAAARPRTPAAPDSELAARLRDLEQLFHGTVENLPVSLVLCDREGRVLYVDPALGEMVRAVCGVAPAALVGKPGREIWPPFVWDPLEAAQRKAVATGQRQSYELTFTLPNGELGHRAWVVLPLAGEDGKVQRVLGINHDVTEQKRLMDELRGADRVKGEFIGLLSHELRNPLSAIRSSLYVLEREESPGEPRARAHRDAARGLIDRQVGHLAHLVDDLLDVTRLSQHKIQLQRRSVDLAHLVREAIEDNRAHLEARGVRLETRLTAGPLLANADAVRVAQVVANLMSNAAKFTPSGGSATVSLSARGGAAELVVADTGCGIEPALLPRLYEPFVQAERTLDRAGGGLGLGLALVRGLVELHGGDVEARSDGTGRGATFVVRLPLDASRTPSSAGTARAAALGRRRVLVIDDDRDVANGLKLALEIDAHEVAVAYDGAEGLAVARAFRPDFVLCDVGMPGMDGYAVARAFRADPELRGIFLVALTGFAQAADRAKARQAGFDEHLAKPANMATINALLAR